MSTPVPLLFFLRKATAATGLAAGRYSTRSFYSARNAKKNPSDAPKRKRTPQDSQRSSQRSSQPPSFSSASKPWPRTSKSTKSAAETPTHRMTPRHSRQLQKMRAGQVMQQRIASFEAEREQHANQWQAKEAKEEKHRKNVQELKQSIQADALRQRQKELERRFANRDGSWKREIHRQDVRSKQTAQKTGRGGSWAKDFGKYVPRAVGTNIQAWTKETQARAVRTAPAKEASTKQISKPEIQPKPEVIHTLPSPPPKPKIATDSKGLPQLKEFYRLPPSLTQRKGKLSVVPSTSPTSQSSQGITSFNSPPLLPGLVSCLHDILGPQANPTEIQRLSIARVLDPVNDSNSSATSPGLKPPSDSKPTTYKEFLLASETGSGKSIAYLLPLLQSLKVSELAQKTPQPHPAPNYTYNPRSLILAPTHELARQLSGFAKTLSHEIKLRVVCTSKANSRNRERDADRIPVKESTVSEEIQVIEMEGETLADGATELNVRPLARGNFADSEFLASSASTRPVDVMVGTPMKFLEMIFGRGWDRVDPSNADAGAGRRSIGKPEMGLSNIEWVIVDEADVLFDPDFNSFTRLLLAEISKARGKEVAFVKEDKILSAECYPDAPDVAPEVIEEGKEGMKASDSNSASESSQSQPPDSLNAQNLALTTRYPFNLILTTATIPPALLFYLQQHHPALFARPPRRTSRPNAGVLRSSGLHRLPSSLKIEQVDWSGGNKLADIEKRLRAVWMEDERRWMGSMGEGQTELSKVIVFCNKSAKVDDLGAYLEGKGIKTVTLTSKIGSAPVEENKEENKDIDTAVEGEVKSEKTERKGSERRRGSNKHLEGFLRVRSKTNEPSDSTLIEKPSSASSAPRHLQPLVVSSSRTSSTRSRTSDLTAPTLSNTPHVLLTTSLLSRGLDFSPSVRHVLIVDEPRNVVDFLHRAGRTARAGTEGVVVVFGKGGRSMSKGKKGLPMEWRGGRS
ncbi:P-loop containing nucleoside triphosphate hydrolase protein [Lentinula aff. detonsa]|uniref:RNA helicase n=1 Tax=Lentinula aff. detonsa TaxID=2804958 RepID=A0AA38KUB1_9AGAR|nr:P-loop containing nucleoside triphosphate hydrolase protein [Lentinula aff. detonsa]